jgi:hypothetical protein
MNQHLNRGLVLLPFLTAMLAGCGDDGSALPSPAVRASSSIAYRLTPTLNPSNDKNGSRVVAKAPPTGTTGLIEELGLVGTFDVLQAIPNAPDLQLDYEITRVALESVDATGQVEPRAPQVMAQGDDVGRIQIRASDGTLAMRLRATVDGLEYELTGEAGPDRYSLAAGQLVLRGVTIQTPDGEPYFGTPTLTFFAAPES